MLTIDEYIACRKQEDNLKDFNLDHRSSNIRKCVNYVFDYFNEYLTQHEQKAKTYMDINKIEKYSSRVSEYCPEVKNWLVDLYSKHYNLINFSLKHAIVKKEYFLLSYKEEDFQIIADDCRTKLSRKWPYLRDEKEGILLFVKDQHRIGNLVFYDDKIPHLPQNIIDWINDTMRNYDIELRTFAYEYSYKVRYDNTILKPIAPNNLFEYSDFKDDLSNKDNLFDIDNLYKEICTRPFIINKKQELQLLILYYWTLVFKDDNIWKICLEVYNEHN
jgi:hypothetical protein